MINNDIELINYLIDNSKFLTYVHVDDNNIIAYYKNNKYLTLEFIKKLENKINHKFDIMTNHNNESLDFIFKRIKK